MPTTCDLPNRARWVAGSATSSPFPFAAPTIVPSMAGAMKRHGGRQSSLTRSLLPDSYGSVHASTKRLADKIAAPQFQPRHWLGTQWMGAVIHALERTVRSHLIRRADP